MMIEVKRIGLPLRPKHLNQLSKYTIDKGCHWALLTNGKEWQLHHVKYGKPPQLIEALSWDLLDDTPARVEQCMKYLSLKSLKKNDLDKLWQRREATLPENILAALMSQSVLNALRREIFKNTKSKVQHEDVVGGVRELFNERSLTRLNELELPKRRSAAKRKPKAESTKTNRPRMNFTEMNIPIGAKLEFTGGNAVVEVASARTVLYNGKEQKLTTITTELLGKKNGVRPAPYWRYQGRLLIDIYNETYASVG